MSIAHFKNDKELEAFAQKFFANRIETFCKDIAICRMPDARGEHAYFPALIICIAFAELLSGCYAGRLEHVPPELNWQDSHGVLDRRFYRH